MIIPESITAKIKLVSTLSDVIENLTPKGRSFVTECPNCKHFDPKKKTGLLYTPSKEIAKCFKCGWAVNNPTTFLMSTRNISFPEALKILADIHSINIEENDLRASRLQYENELKIKNRKTFRDLQLESSGLTAEDITAYIKDPLMSEHQVPVFRSGTKDQYGNILPGRGDDMLIYYYDLQGNPVMYRKEKQNKMAHLIRIRWQNPELHLDKEGRPKKYESPYGSGSHLYIPEKLRQKYKAGEPIDVLFLQEGEKKSEKACKHEIHSAGTMGIQNIGYKNHSLPPELQLIVQRCDTKHIVFFLDSDWDQLSDKIKNGDQVDQRQRSFFYAVKNFKEYMRTLVNLGISVEIWFGYIKTNTSNSKGVDDLLTAEFKDKEHLFKQDIQDAMHHKDGFGNFVQMHKITMMSDAQIADLWLLNDAEAFSRKHKEKLSTLTEFKIGKLKRRFDEHGKLILAQPLMPAEQFWEETYVPTRSGDERKEISFDYSNCFNFLMNRGFFRARLKSNSWEFVHIENKVVHKVDNYDIKDFVTEFTKELKRKDVLNMLYRGGPQYLGYEKLSNLDYINLSLEKATQDTQCLFFQDEIWKISADQIEVLSYAEFKHHVWEDKIIKAKVKKLDPLIEVQIVDDKFRKKIKDEFYADTPNGEFFYDFSEDGRSCHFLTFLENTSNFIWNKKKRLLRLNGDAEPKDQITANDHLYNSRHLVNKLTAIGYLLHDYKNDSELKAVIGMDAKLSEIGASNGRTGKSLVGKALEFVIPQVYIPAKSYKLTEDAFLFGEVTEKHKNIFLDDVRSNIDFEFFFPLISGKLKVNPKGNQPFTLDQADTPKLYITTNHAISGEGASFKDRQAFMAFSDFYNENHKPVDDFGINFFSEWDNDQWNLFYNLMANCIMLYFKSIRDEWSGKNVGMISPPMESILQRQLKQMIGEDFIQWADAIFTHYPDGSPSDGSMLNIQLIRKELFDDFIEKNFHARKYITTTSFGKRMRLYCKFRNFHFNPHKISFEGMRFFDFIKAFPGSSYEGETDKTAGKEFWTVATDKWTGTF